MERDSLVSQVPEEPAVLHQLQAAVVGTEVGGCSGALPGVGQQDGVGVLQGSHVPSRPHQGVPLPPLQRSQLQGL